MWFFEHRNSTIYHEELGSTARHSCTIYCGFPQKQQTMGACTSSSLSLNNIWNIFFTISQSEWCDIQLCTMAEKWMKEGRDRNMTFTVRFHFPCTRLLTTAKKYSEAGKEACFPWRSCLLQLNFGGFQRFVKDIFADRPFVSFEIYNRLGAVNMIF